MGLLAGVASSCRKEWEVFVVVSSFLAMLDRFRDFSLAILRVRTEMEPNIDNPKP